MDVFSSSIKTGRGGASIYGQKFNDEIHEDLKHTGKFYRWKPHQHQNNDLAFICIGSRQNDQKHLLMFIVEDNQYVEGIILDFHGKSVYLLIRSNVLYLPKTAQIISLQ